MIVEMAPNATENRGKEPANEVSDTASNVGEPMQGELLLAIQNVMKEIAQHRTEMAAQRNADSGRQTEHTSSRQTRHTVSRQSKHTSSLKTEATSSFIPPETSRRASGRSMTDKLAKFKKFAPPSFSEAKKPEEAEA